MSKLSKETTTNETTTNPTNPVSTEASKTETKSVEKTETSEKPAKSPEKVKSKSTPAKSVKKPVKPAKVAAKSEKKVAPKKAAKSEKKAAKPAKSAKPVAKKNVKVAAKKKRTADNSDRNFGRVKFNGQELSKGRAVHAVVAAFVEKKKPTAAQLISAFPDELLKNYGIVREINQARKYNVNGKTRYFVGSDDVIKTKDGNSMAVCNQFSTENIKPFIKHAKTLGFTLTVSSK